MTDKERYLELCEAAYDGRLIRAHNPNCPGDRPRKITHPNFIDLMVYPEHFDIAPETVTKYQLRVYKDPLSDDIIPSIKPLDLIYYEFEGTLTFTLDDLEKPLTLNPQEGSDD